MENLWCFPAGQKLCFFLKDLEMWLFFSDEKTEIT